MAELQRDRPGLRARLARGASASTSLASGASYNIVLRVIPLQIKTFEELNLPTCTPRHSRRAAPRPTCSSPAPPAWASRRRCATMLKEINHNRKAKIDHDRGPHRVRLHARQVHHHAARDRHTDTESFPDALHAALRQDPDVIMVGEMRDLETVDTSLKAAETGHLVFSTIHTSDVASTINRLVSFFPVGRAAPGARPHRGQHQGHRLAAPASSTRRSTEPGAGGRGHALARGAFRSASGTPPASRRILNDFDRAGPVRHAACRPSISTCSTCIRPTRSRLETARDAASNPTRLRRRSSRSRATRSESEEIRNPRSRSTTRTSRGSSSRAPGNPRARHRDPDTLRPSSARAPAHATGGTRTLSGFALVYALEHLELRRARRMARPPRVSPAPRTRSPRPATALCEPRDAGRRPEKPLRTDAPLEPDVGSPNGLTGGVFGFPLRHRQRPPVAVVTCPSPRPRMRSTTRYSSSILRRSHWSWTTTPTSGAGGSDEESTRSSSSPSSCSPRTSNCCATTRSSARSNELKNDFIEKMSL